MAMAREFFVRVKSTGFNIDLKKHKNNAFLEFKYPDAQILKMQIYTRTMEKVKN